MEKILIIDDDKDFQFTISNILKDEGYDAIAIGDGKGALETVKRSSPNLVLLDIKLPDIDGIKILEEIKRINKDLIVIMITGYGGINEAVTAMKLGAFDYITKPFDNRELIIRIKKALQTQDLSKEVESLKKRLTEKIVVEETMGKSPQIKRVLNQVKIVAPTNLTVILQGESGTGKEVIAQMIHQASRRKDKPFIAIDCGAIPEALAESELFGHEKGAFTGSEIKKEGRFEEAKEGTLFLDEIANLSDAIQIKLLRVVQEKKLHHLGGKKDIKIDARIIIATNIDLFEAVRSGKFRNDLFQRLNEFYISLPPLRERKEDIPILAKYFLIEANNELNKNIKGFSTEAMKFLLNYHWPGNIRELKNLIRKEVLLADSEYITLGNVSQDIIKLQDEIEITKTLAEGFAFREITKNFEKNLIQKALEKVGNNKTKAAEILNIQRKALYRKMKSLGL
jgi:DNA-binding NtrC family response regulator